MNPALLIFRAAGINPASLILRGRFASPGRAAAAGTPLAGLALSGAAGATEYASASEVLDAIDRLEADVDRRLAVIANAVTGAQAFSGSVAADHAAHRAERQKLRRRLKLAAASVPPPTKPDPSLPGLREAQQQLVHAHAEGLPALGNAGAVDLLARHMVDGARHLTVIDLWIEAEQQRG
jgi:hypothetical protein